MTETTAELIRDIAGVALLAFIVWLAWRKDE